MDKIENLVTYPKENLANFSNRLCVYIINYWYKYVLFILLRTC